MSELESRKRFVRAGLSVALLQLLLCCSTLFAAVAEAAPSSAGYTWPLKTAGTLTQGFSPGGHGGIDIGVADGTEVLAAMDGTVKYIHDYNARASLDDSSMNSYGRLVILYA